MDAEVCQASCGRSPYPPLDPEMAYLVICYQALRYLATTTSSTNRCRRPDRLSQSIRRPARADVRDPLIGEAADGPWHVVSRAAKFQLHGRIRSHHASFREEGQDD